MGRWSTYARRGSVERPQATVPPLVLYNTHTAGPTFQSTAPPWTYQARRVKATTAGTLLAFRLYFTRTGSPSGSLIFQVFADGDLIPGPLVAQWTGPLAVSLPPAATWFSTPTPAVPMPLSSRWWVAIGCPGASPGNFISAGMLSPPDALLRRQAQSPDGVNWTNVAHSRSWITTLWGVAP